MKIGPAGYSEARSKVCEPIGLQPGLNLVGTGCAPQGCTAHQFLRQLGTDLVASIQRYLTAAGTFQTIAFGHDGDVQGADFPIVPGGGYFVQMKAAVDGFGF